MKPDDSQNLQMGKTRLSFLPYLVQLDLRT